MDTPNTSPDSGIFPNISDERFQELTRGLSRADIHPLVSDLSRYRLQRPIEIGGKEIEITPGNTENGHPEGTLVPQIDVTGAGALTTFLSFGGEKLAISVLFPEGELKDLGPVKASVSTKMDPKQVQSEVDFELIPQEHWLALVVARDALAKMRETNKTPPAQVSRPILKRLFGRRAWH